MSEPNDQIKAFIASLVNSLTNDDIINATNMFKSIMSTNVEKYYNDLINNSLTENEIINHKLIRLILSDTDYCSIINIMKAKEYNDALEEVNIDITEDFANNVLSETPYDILKLEHYQISSECDEYKQNQELIDNDGWFMPSYDIEDYNKDNISKILISVDYNCDSIIYENDMDNSVYDQLYLYGYNIIHKYHDEFRASKSNTEYTLLINRINESERLNHAKYYRIYEIINNNLEDNNSFCEDFIFNNLNKHKIVKFILANFS